MPAIPVDEQFMRLALLLARRGYGTTSPNPMVGAVIVRNGKVLGKGWHRRAGQPHAEIEALVDAQVSGRSVKGATLYVTLEPCCTHGRTPPCTNAIVAAKLKRVVVGAIDPNPNHGGKGLHILRRAGLTIQSGLLEEECKRLNEAFNHWIVHRTPWVILKAAMTLDGRIATASGESKWITGEEARAVGMRLRQGADAILVGVNTILHDDPSLTLRTAAHRHPLSRIILDSRARTPLDARVVTDGSAHLTTIVVGERAPKLRVTKLSRYVRVLTCPVRAGPDGSINLAWLLNQLGRESVASLLVEGGGLVNASFLGARLVHRIVFFYAPKIIGGTLSKHVVEGQGAATLAEALRISEARWEKKEPT